jgi:hypothetical protein
MLSNKSPARERAERLANGYRRAVSRQQRFVIFKRVLRPCYVSPAGRSEGRIIAAFSVKRSFLTLPAASIGRSRPHEVTMPIDDRVKGGGYGLERLNG